MSKESSLLKISFTVDDDPLQKYVQLAVTDALSKARAEIASVRREVKEVLSEVAEVKRELADLKHGTIEKIIGVVEDMVAVMMTSPAGRSGLRKNFFVRKEKEMLHARRNNFDSSSSMLRTAEPFPHLEDLERAGNVEEGGGPAEVDLDEERLRGIETGLLAAKQSLADLMDQVIPSRERAVDKWMCQSNSSFRKLLEFLGLDYLGASESVAKKSEIESCPYLQQVSDALGDQSRRCSFLESGLKTKIERNELEAIAFAVKDVRGSSDATAKRCEQIKDDLKAALDDVKRATNVALDSKAPWTDLDGFKKGNMEALKSLRGALAAAQKDSTSLRQEVSASIEELEKKILGVQQTAGTTAAAAASLVHPPHSVTTKVVDGGPLHPAPQQPPGVAISAANHQSAAVVDTAAGPVASSSVEEEGAQAEAAAVPTAVDGGDDQRGSQSLVKRRVYHATNSAFFNYAEVVPSPGIRVTTTTALDASGGEIAQTQTSQVATKRRPQSALLVRK